MFEKYLTVFFHKLELYVSFAKGRIGNFYVWILGEKLFGQALGRFQMKLKALDEVTVLLFVQIYFSFTNKHYLGSI